MQVFHHWLQIVVEVVREAIVVIEEKYLHRPQRNSMKQIIETSKAPAPIGPYSQAVRYGDMIFCSGQIALDPHSGELIMDSIEAETHQVMKNISAVLEEAGADFGHILKSSIFLSDMALFPRVNEVYGSYFEGDSYPARETVAVKELPKSVNVEISIIVGL
jgi:2-iminobutanoate/2-iminopropanoate deaminase